MLIDMRNSYFVRYLPLPMNSFFLINIYLWHWLSTGYIAGEFDAKFD